MVESNSQKRFLISVDGSNYSELGFDLIIHEFFNKMVDYAGVIHIKNQNQKDLPFKLQAKSVESDMISKLIGIPKDHQSITISESNDKEIHELSQVYNHMKKMSCQVLVVGSQGGSLKKKGEISSGIKYLLTNIVGVPCFIIKEYTPRLKKTNKAYTWVVAVDSKGTRAWKAMEAATSFFSKSDKIICVHFNNSKKESSEIELEYVEHCKKSEITTLDFRRLDIDHKLTLGAQISSFINSCEDCPDFVIIGHNHSKYQNQESLYKSPVVEIISNASANILYYS